MTDIHIQGLRALAAALPHSPRRLGLELLSADQPAQRLPYITFHRRDIEEVCAALEARDARIAELEEELTSHNQAVANISEVMDEIEKAKEYTEDDDDLSEADDALDRALNLLGDVAQ